LKSGHFLSKHSAHYGDRGIKWPGL